MKLTERMDWPGGPPLFELNLEVPLLVSGEEIRIFSTAYGVDGETIDFSIATQNLNGGPLHDFSIASISAAVVAQSPRGWPILLGEPRLPEAGITSPPPSLTVAPQTGMRLYAIDLGSMFGHRGDLRIRAHGYRISEGSLWFYFKLQEPEQTFDIASVSASMLNGAPSEAVVEICNEPEPEMIGNEES
ncbi:hypothetical protein [Nocardia sp. XZ_19_369]|uniref:hypothetical protein n=1 Tax=Nocardia sp. XZ_19_369 TaxID=2769487 RepID=UPI00188DD0AD|nr:hypothetical protein [Nocardia sp. XZ_19_369]